jgi:hypothetical protein
MWGYTCLGAATWFAAVVFDQTRTERVISRLMVANGALSLAAGMITSARLEWVMSIPGLAAYTVWNVLMLALFVLLIVAFGNRSVGSSEAISRTNSLETSSRVADLAGSPH